MERKRRNGQLPSCEPCRKSKLGCDHTRPICNRCVRRGRTDECFYHPSPLTKPRQSNATAQSQNQDPSASDNMRDLSVSSTVSGSSAAHHPSPLTKPRQSKAAAIRKPRQKLTHSPSQSQSQQNANVSVNASVSPIGVHTVSVSVSASVSASPLTIGESHAWEKRPFANPGFLGLTSYSDNVTGYAARGSGSGSIVAAVDSRQVELGAQVLLLLDHLPLFEELLEKRFAIWEGWIFSTQMFRCIIKVLREHYRDATEGVRDKYAAVLELSRTLFRNTVTEIELRASMTLSEYVALSGARWDSYALLLSSIGYAIYHVAHDDPIFQSEILPGNDRKGLRRIALAASDICLQLCDKLGTISDSLCCAILQHSVLVHHTYGTGDYRTWQKLGDLTTIVFALGLHQAGDDRSIPFFLSELRKRIMIGAYAMDKDLALFLGRPPRICKQYCNIQSPLDLTWEELIAAPTVRQAALLKLDAQGWNTEGKLGSGARARTIHLACLIREDILELSIGQGRDNVEEHAERVLKRARQWRSELPAFLQWGPESTNPELATLHQEFLHQDFLIYSTLVKRIGKGHDALIKVSLEIITCLLDLVSRQMRFLKTHMLTILDLCYIGLPAAGALATELLRHSQPKLEPVLSSAPFPRSEIIQKLSVFISHADTFIQQHEGDYELALQGQKLIRQVLDRVLSPMADPSFPDPLINGMTIGDDVDFMALLESFDWEQEIRPTFS
ncbi:putative chromatin structure remodeling complex protein RSC3 [Aspergillus novofumigatus IBT 16806]|uniref:Putative chromatin structure remodeling complex protein RSC3 n=1 Tax=Aspergillus novofumigatus (strain IBT 16806) TaxID=1392255 RepID=A0A2I1BVL4_ASPN1|nr:putative chromatin structure remodeling complex protein RSC3 [Aspergillus novofumigatus IBT 16806]PKX89414.1 putative chromatin structure remodeling complex protein RSC3 [Aspergillus novofumigatus IBT 16806]